MLTLFRRIATAAAIAGALSSPGWADAVVVVTEDAGLDAEAVRTLRSLAATDLRGRGVPVLEQSSFDHARALDADARADLAESGADRLFVLRLGRLDRKLIVSFEELVPDTLAPVGAASLTAETLDDADVVIPRLVRAVVGREPVDRGARLLTVTAQEAEPFRKKPGEGLFVIGVSLAPLGGSVGWSYEARSWRLGVLYQGADDDVSFFGLDGAWIPSDGSVSPYVGAGLGVVSPRYGGDSVAGTRLEAGVEFFRLHGVRLMAGVSAIVPFESRPGTDSVNLGLQIRAGF